MRVKRDTSTQETQINGFSQLGKLLTHLRFNLLKMLIVSDVHRKWLLKQGPSPKAYLITEMEAPPLE